MNQFELKRQNGRTRGVFEGVQTGRIVMVRNSRKPLQDICLRAENEGTQAVKLETASFRFSFVG